MAEEKKLPVFKTRLEQVEFYIEYTLKFDFLPHISILSKVLEEKSIKEKCIQMLIAQLNEPKVRDLIENQNENELKNLFLSNFSTFIENDTVTKVQIGKLQTTNKMWGHIRGILKLLK